MYSIKNENLNITASIAYDKYVTSYTSVSSSFCECVGPFEGAHSPNCHTQIIQISREIENCFRKTRNYVIDLKILESVYSLSFQYHYNIPLIQHFPNLSCLTLENTKFKLDSLNYLFKGLSVLEYLELNNICVLSYSSYSHHTIDLQFPTSVKSLNINSGVTISPQSEDLSSYVDILTNGTRYLHFRPQHMPKLKKIVYANKAGSFDATITGFYNLNPQLIYLGFSANALTTDLLNHISISSSLQKLAIIHYKNLIAIPLDSNLPILHSIVELEIELSSDYSIQTFERLIQAAPNICHLHIHLYMLSFDVYHNLSKKIEPVAQIFKNLKTLSITSHSLLCDFSLEIPSFPNLEYLNLLNARLHKVNLVEYEKYSAIKCIYLGFNHPYYRSNIEFGSFKEKFPNWKINNFHKSLKCYKINN
ncbi:hypothetical protein CONCODRAFT_70470 [Conidiobolus coronatus NRRL 28638]|uniref:RNI-like protein n=1 Tax=Conidiobolus coronatus (strain ATCC 28846 / CBS 209.66 / NRRL 28638) TaxID=796925 RepID=A0A137P6W1_CONC2|nr:hypothetical protein CONCODRAFT_70470 [Conidiobolus coronatus NRRL 28638]|eukprot:KXN70674.1 hypothetical protein CONCODRAFT_70470 [Conidiobolus coronatus NRRL 28638]